MTEQQTRPRWEKRVKESPYFHRHPCKQDAKTYHKFRDGSGLTCEKLRSHDSAPNRGIAL